MERYWPLTVREEEFSPEAAVQPTVWWPKMIVKKHMQENQRGGGGGN